jgi:hypothetical protein
MTARAAVRPVPVFTLVAAGLLFFAVAALVIYDARYHEFWRDEVQPILVGQNVPLRRFLTAKKVDGTPPLLDLVTVPFVGIMSPFHRMLITCAVGFTVLLFGTYRCLLSICCSRVASLVMTALLALTYIYAYEFGVVVRVYGMGAGFALLSNGYLRDALRGHSMRPVFLGTLAGGLSLLTSTHAATIAGGAFVAFGLVSLWRHRGIKLVLPTLAVLPCLAVTWAIIKPFTGRTSEANLDLKRPLAEFLMYSHQALSASFTPQDWWVTASFGNPHTLDVIALLRHWGQIGVIAAALYGLALRLTPLYRQYRALLVFDVISVLVGWAALLEIVVNHYWGSPRHHCFFSLPVIVLACGWSVSPGLARWPWAGALALPLMAPWFAFQYVVCARDLALDVQQPFSDTKEAAAMLDPGAHLVADSLTTEESFLLWRPDIVMRGGDHGGRHLGYLVTDNAWHMGAAALPMVREECAVAPDKTYYSGYTGARYNLGGASRCLHLVRAATPHSEQTRPDELVELWQVDCPCALRGQ